MPRTGPSKGAGQGMVLGKAPDVFPRFCSGKIMILMNHALTSPLAGASLGHLQKSDKRALSAQTRCEIVISDALADPR